MKKIYLMEIERSYGQSVRNDGRPDYYDRTRNYIYFQRLFEKLFSDEKSSNLYGKKYFETKDLAEKYVNNKVDEFVKENADRWTDSDEGGSKELLDFINIITYHDEDEPDLHYCRIVYRVTKKNSEKILNDYICIDSWRYEIKELELN